MKYPKIVHVINIVFALVFFISPIIFAISNIHLSQGIGRFLFLLGFILLALSLTDWYHLYLSNTYKGIFYNFFIFGFLSIVAVIIPSIMTGNSFINLALLSNVEFWPGYGFLKVYITCFGLSFISILSLPRLVLIKLVTNKPLPQYNELKN